MKGSGRPKGLLFLLALALLLLASACTAAGETGPGQPAPVLTGEIITARVLDPEGNPVILAGLDAPYDEVYALPPGVLASAGVGTEVRVGDTVQLAFDGSVEETFPARLGQITQAAVLSEGYDGLCPLYLDVLEDLWSADPALQDGISRLGFDLASTRLAPSEQQALALTFARAHGIEDTVFGTWQELADQGVLNGEELYWPEGVLLSIREKDTIPNPVNAVTFDAEKWRSGLGAYSFVDCTSRRRSDGAWTSYTIGSEAVS